MRHNFSATGIFILDREGAVVFDESHHGRLHFLARSLALASRRPGASAGNVHVKIGAGATLEVIPVETAHGGLVLGLVALPINAGAAERVLAGVDAGARHHLHQRGVQRLQRGERPALDVGRPDPTGPLISAWAS